MADERFLSSSLTRATDPALAIAFVVAPADCAARSAPNWRSAIASWRRVRFCLMRLFGRYERSDASRSPECEDMFTFLNRSARPDVVNIRAEIERWFKSYPADNQAELLSKFRNRRQHGSAWWELYLHRLFTLLGFEVEVHPELDGVSTRPDFEVTRPTGQFLLEAATTEAGIVEPGRDGTREGWIIDALNAAPHANFFVSLRFRLVGQQRPRNVEIAGPVAAWLDGLEADEILATSNFPEQEFVFRDWRIRLRAIPKSPEWRGVHDGDVLVGMGPATGGFVNDRERMLAKLRDKSGKYGAPGLPIVVAVNLLSTFGEERAVEQALFGSLAIHVPIGGDPTSAETFRQQDGFWMRDGQPLATRVSAVLEGPGLSPWTIAQKWPRLWLNPWAAHPLEIDIPIPRRVGDTTGHVEYLDSQTTPGRLFDLAEDWPGPIS